MQAAGVIMLSREATDYSKRLNICIHLLQDLTAKRMNCYLSLLKIESYRYMYRRVGSSQFLLLGGFLLSVVAVSHRAVNASTIATSFKNVFIDSYIIAYFDRATWITGCF